MERLADEGEYHPRGRGVQQGGLPKETDVQCNGDFTDTTGDHSQTKGSQEKTTEVHLEDYSHKLVTSPLAVPIPFQDVAMEPAGQPTTPTFKSLHPMQDHDQVQEVHLTASGVPLETTAEGSAEKSGVCASEGGGEGMGEGGGEEDMEVMSGEGELQVVIALEEKTTPTTGDIIPSITVRNGPHQTATTSAVDISAQPIGGAEGHLTSRLLAGLVFHLTGYLEVMEEDTLAKWKEVNSLLLVTSACDLT